MTFNEFVKTYLNKAVDYDGAYGVQCVDLAKLYIKKVIGVEPQAIGNAHAYYDDFDKTYLKKYFKRIPYKAGVQAQKGDLVVWGKNYDGKSEHGHIAIATGEENKTYIYTYDENWGSAAMKKVRHTYKGLSGFLRPIDQSKINPPEKNDDKKPIETTDGKKVHSNGAESFDSAYKNGKSFTVTSKTGLRLRKKPVDGQLIVVMPYNAKVMWYGYYTKINGVIWRYVEYKHNNKKYVGFCSGKYLK